ncbi:MAG: leucyl aminopeptidase family protein [Marmoricola sp.]
MRKQSRRPLRPWELGIEPERASQAAPVEIEVTDAAPAAITADAVVVPVLLGDEAPVLGPGSDALEAATGLDLIELLQSAGQSGEVGEILRVPVTDGGVVLLGAGTGDAADCRRAAAVMVRELASYETVTTTLAALGGDDVLAAIVEGITLAHATFAMRSTEHDRLLGRVILADCSPDAGALEVSLATAHAAALARALATVPSNIKSPAWLADQAVLQAERAGLEVEVWEESRLAREGFGGVLAVGSGSATPPRFVQLTYTPAKVKRSTPHIVLVGKGITFDTGGLSIKPGEGMVTMKRDMTGAGVVLAVLSALAAVDCGVKVTGLLPIAENAVGGASMRPGDVITHFGGRTSEVTNTDAEGRLVLADALAYAAARLKPTALVDIATLTGAAKVALGLHLGAVFATEDHLAEELIAAGAAAGEPLWRLPLAEIYNDRLASKVADADNAPGSAGAITAALFLQPFTAGLPWVHLDVAPVGDSLEDAFEYAKGPTGFGARLLLRWLGTMERSKG